MFRLVPRFSVSDSQDYLSMNRVKGSQFRDVVPSPRSSDPSQGSPCLDVTKFCFLRQLRDCPTFVLASLISPGLSLISWTQCLLSCHPLLFSVSPTLYFIDPGPSGHRMLAAADVYCPHLSSVAAPRDPEFLWFSFTLFYFVTL